MRVVVDEIGFDLLMDVVVVVVLGLVDVDSSGEIRGRRMGMESILHVRACVRVALYACMCCVYGSNIVCMYGFSILLYDTRTYLQQNTWLFD